MRQRKNDDPAYLDDLRESATIVASRLEKTALSSFVEDVALQDGILRRMSIIGEAARHLTEATKKKYPQIPWSNLVMLRNAEAHTYWNLEAVKIWRFVDSVIPVILQSLDEE